MNNLSLLPLSPYAYRQDSHGNQIITRENTLRDVVSEYLYSAVVWLLGYEASAPITEQKNKKPIRVQDVGTPWLLALAVCYLAESWLSLHQEHPELSAELDMKLLSRELDENSKGAVWWLLEPRTPDWALKSDQLLYDVSVTLLALLKVVYTCKTINPTNWNSELEQQIWAAITPAAKWLENQLSDESFVISDLTQTGGQHLGRTFELLAFFTTHFPKEFSKVFEKENIIFKQLIAVTLRFAESKINESEERPLIAITTIQRDFFYGLACLVLATKTGTFLNKIHFDSSTHLVGKTLEVYANWYESAVLDKSAGGFFSTVRNLAIYVRVDEALSTIIPSRNDRFLPERIVWATVRSFTGKGTWYPNGSIYDSGLTETIWLLGCLTTLHAWQRTNEKVIVLLDKCLTAVVRTPILEREEVFRLREELSKMAKGKAELLDNKHKEQKRFNRERLIYSISAVIVLTLYVLALLLPVLGLTTPILNPNFVLKDLSSVLATIGLVLPGAIAFATFLYSLRREE